jgi:hypothetical protein
MAVLLGQQGLELLARRAWTVLVGGRRLWRGAWRAGCAVAGDMGWCYGVSKSICVAERRLLQRAWDGFPGSPNGPGVAVYRGWGEVLGTRELSLRPGAPAALRRRGRCGTRGRGLVRRGGRSRRMCAASAVLRRRRSSASLLVDVVLRHGSVVCRSNEASPRTRVEILGEGCSSSATWSVGIRRVSYRSRYYIGGGNCRAVGAAPGPEATKSSGKQRARGQSAAAARKRRHLRKKQGKASKNEMK